MSSAATECDGYTPIAGYALIGDCCTAALISQAGSIDWYCPGRFDAPAVFCRVLDADRGGFFQVAPAGDFAVTRRYLGDTNILVTTHRGRDAEVTVTDYMPLPAAGPDSRETRRAGGAIVRHVEVVSGSAEIRVEFRPTFNYARDETHVDAAGKDGVVAGAGGEYLALACPGLESRGNGLWAAALHLDAGDRVALRLSHAQSREEALRELRTPVTPETLEGTQHFWEQWAAQCTYQGAYRPAVVRSALALKLLVYEPTGAIVAAPTTSLPEQLGGVRNWDYRYTWLRDSSFIMYSLLTVGYDHAAAHFLDWLRTVIVGEMPARPQIMYGIDGRRDLPEENLENLEGYCRSRPVRIGNAAAHQQQTDIYGEVLIAAYIHYCGFPALRAGSAFPGAAEGPDEAAWQTLRMLVDDAVASWREPDEGIWEVRAGPQQFVYSKVMCWAAVDRGIRMARAHNLPADLDRWESARDAIRAAVEEHGYNERIGAFVQSFDSDILDASVLVIPRIGFLSPTDPRVLSTLDVIQQHLMVNGLVYRYRTVDGLPGAEGTFLLVTFWLVDALALAGQTDKAQSLFEHALSFANDVGLFSEEVDPATSAFLGNFPQGFTHLALIQAAADLAVGVVRGPGVEAETEGERIHHASRAVAGEGSSR